MYNFPTSIFSCIRAERDDFLHNYIQIVPGYDFNQYETVKKIHLYYNSRFVDGQYETINGVRRQNIFHNISKWRCDVWTKQLDIDTKDFALFPLDPETEWNVRLFEKELKVWLKKSKHGKVLNEIVRYLPIYGSVVIKKVKGGTEVIDLRNFFCDQSAKDLKSSRYILQKHLMSPAELRAKSGVWENTDKVIETQTQYQPESYEEGGAVKQMTGSPFAEVWERYGEVPLSWFTDKEKDEDIWVLAHYIVSGVNDVKRNSQGKIYADDGVVLFKEQLTELPFKECHVNKTEGRWLGIGVVEDTFEAQRMRNRIANLEDRALELASMIVFQTTDPTAVRNLISDVNNGDLLVTKNAISRLDNTQRSLPELRSVAQQYDELANRQTFSADVLSGETPPASATATAVVSAIQQAGSVFDFKKENIGLFLEEYFRDLVFPEVQKELNKKHLFHYTGSSDEMKALREEIADAVIDQAKEKLIASGVNIDEAVEEQEKERIMEQLRGKQSSLWLEVQDNFYKNLDYNMDFAIVNESKNVQSNLQNIQAVLGLIGKNPAILQNPILKRLIFKMLSLIGISASELDMIEREAVEAEQSPEEQMQQQLPQSPQPQAQIPSIPQNLASIIR